jgi:rare lipoprotein A
MVPRSVTLLSLCLFALAGDAAYSEPVTVGLASWYGAYHEGRLTASGCIFHADHLSAASRSLPIGAWVRVRRAHRSVVVQIEDRGPYVAGRILDLSRAAAERLDAISAGVVLVSLEVTRLHDVPRCRTVGYHRPEDDKNGNQTDGHGQD